MFWSEYLRTHGNVAFFDGEAGGGGSGGDNGNGNNNGGGGGNGNNTPPPKDPPWKSEFGDEFDGDKAWNLIQTLRTQERTLKKERDDASKRAKEFEDKDKSELEKVTGKLTEMETQLAEYKKREQDARVSGTVTDAAKKAGAVYPDDVYALVSSRLELDNDGKPTNTDALIRELKASRPMLFTKTVIDGKNGNRSSQEGDKVGNSEFNTAVRSMFGR